MLAKIEKYFATEMGLDKNQLEVIIFGLESLLSTFFSVTLTIMLSFFFGTTNITIVILISSAFIKAFAGGAHCKTMLNCAIFSALVYNAIAKVIYWLSITYPLKLEYIVLITAIVSLILHYKWAPAKTIEKQISEKYSNKLRILTFYSLICVFSILIVLLFLGANNYSSLILAICAGVLWHTFTITPPGYKVIEISNTVLSRFTKGGVFCAKN